MPELLSKSCTIVSLITLYTFPLGIKCTGKLILYETSLSLLVSESLILSALTLKPCQEFDISPFVAGGIAFKSGLRPNAWGTALLKAGFLLQLCLLCLLCCKQMPLVALPWPMAALKERSPKRLVSVRF